MTLQLSPWALLLLAVPLLLLGETINRRISILTRFNIPVSVTAGLTVALLLLGLRMAGGPVVSFQTTVTSGWWTWLVTPEVDWFARPAKTVSLPLLVGFFTCIGLNATLGVLRGGSKLLILLLSVATLLAVAQNVLGIAMAKALGESPLLGMICGALTLTGGHATALGFSPLFVQAGFPAAASAGAAAATFGLVASALVAAPFATWLIRRHSLARSRADGKAIQRHSLGFVQQVRLFAGYRQIAAIHLLILLACIKVGAWAWYFIQKAGIVFPVYMGALFVGLGVRTIVDRWKPGFLRSEVFDRLGSILLGLFLAVTLASLNLGDLASVAGPMIIILGAQVVLMVAFACWVTWPVMGRDYEAAIMAAGHVGLGLGNTATAVASMDALVARYEPAPKAYTVVPPLGGFLIDLTNAVVITAFLNFFK